MKLSFDVFGYANQRDLIIVLNQKNVFIIFIGYSTIIYSSL